jgi:hypothetical protein
VPADGTKEQPIELAVIARQAGVRITLIRRYIEFGCSSRSPERTNGRCLSRAAGAAWPKAERLRRDLGVNYAGAVLARELRDRIRELEDQTC